MQIKSVAGCDMWSSDHETMRETVVAAVEADANLAGAYLDGAYLAGANLDGANLDGANLGGAKLRDGILIERRPLQISGLRWRVTIWDAHMQIGCEFHGLADWYSYDDRRINRMDSNALRFWRAHKAALFALAASDGRWVEPAAAGDGEKSDD